MVMSRSCWVDPVRGAPAAMMAARHVPVAPRAAANSSSSSSTKARRMAAVLRASRGSGRLTRHWSHTSDAHASSTLCMTRVKLGGKLASRGGAGTSQAGT